MPDGLDERVAGVRRFNRFYTQRIGILQESLLRSPFSLTEARVLYEIAHRQQPTASEIAVDLALDAGYLSRILGGFTRQKLVRRSASEADGRKTHLHLTEKGQQAFARLNAESHHEIGGILSAIPTSNQRRLLDAMNTIETILGAQPEHGVPYLLRPPQSGDMGWVVQRHGALYAEEYGWNDEFEGLVAEIVAHFIRHFDPRRERCWIAEREGENVGSVFLVKKTKRVAKLRLLLVEPKARGLGIGKRLVSECIRFARQAGYKMLMLWTNDVLHAARHIYISNGFKLLKDEKHHSFGHDLVGQTWELKL